MSQKGFQNWQDKIDSVINGNKQFALLQGDCFDILPLISPRSIRLIVADPPYNVSKAGGRYGFKGKKFVSDGWDIIKDYPAFSKKWMDLCRNILFDNGTMYVWGYHRSLPYMPINEWYQLNLLVWHKRNAFPTTMQNSIWSPSCEFAYFLRKNRGKDHVFHIGKKDFARDFFNGTTVTNKRHPTEKPLDITMEMLRRATNKGDIVVSPFMGSGTDGEAAIKLGCKFIGIEKTPPIFDVAQDRIYNIMP